MKISSFLNEPGKKVNTIIQFYHAQNKNLTNYLSIFEGKLLNNDLCYENKSIELPFPIVCNN